MIYKLLIFLTIFSMPFSRILLFGIPYFNIHWLSLFTIIGYGYINLGNKKQIWENHKYLLQPLIYFVIIFIVVSWWNDSDYVSSPYTFVRQLVLVILTMPIISECISRRIIKIEDINNYLLILLTFLSVLFLLGIGIEYDEGRLRYFGNNANASAMTFVFGTAILFHRILNKKYKIVSILLLLFYLVIIANTGSRSAALVFFIIPIIYLIKSNYSLRFKIFLFLIIIVLLIIVAVIFSNVGVLEERLSAENPLEGRTNIWNIALDIYMINPIFGIGASGWEAEITKYFWKYRSPHNIYLMVLLYTGIVGFYFMSKLWIRIIKISKHVIDRDVFLYYSIMIVSYIAFITDSGLLMSYLFWLFVGCILGMYNLQFVKYKKITSIS